eukprot:6298970-Heterocapsa_arctica.AAC.1
MAEGLVAPFRRAFVAYNTFLLVHQHDQSVAVFSGASDSSAVATVVAHPQETPEAIALRKLLIEP